MLLHSAVLFALLVYVHAMLPMLSHSNLIPQETLMQDALTEEHEKVPGDNPAYFSRVARSEQLFSISEFTVSPLPPVSNHRIFFYLRGSMDAQADLPGLANATLELRIASTDEDDDSKPYFFKNKISDVGLFTVRFDEEKGRAYGGPLVQGRVNEFVGDLFFQKFGHEHGTDVWNVEAIAKLPDKRVLFAFQGKVSYDY